MGNDYNGACINWYDVDFGRILCMLAGEGNNEAWQQVTALGQTYELLAYHAGELKKCRDELVALAIGVFVVIRRRRS